MPLEPSSESNLLRNSARFQSAKKELLETILEASSKLRVVRQASSAAQSRENYSKVLQEFTKDRGRDLYFPFLGSGMGCGPYVELIDGSIKLDMITGIGINFFGHTHPALMEEMIDSLPSDVMQGNLQPGIEIRELMSSVLGKASSGSKLSHGWVLCSGTMANETALKIIRQKKAPATKILAFKDCFAGRSTAMQEITDNPAYRQGQPIYGEVHYLPFYNPKVDLKTSIQETISVLRENVWRYPNQFAALMIELVQGEGGFQYAPRDFYLAVFEEAKKAGLAIWIDEVQTFGRTGELFAFQKFSLHEWVDVVTIGKLLHACMVLYTDEFNPRPGLVAGTFTGSTVALKTAKRIIDLLCNEGFLGHDGRIEKLSSRFVKHLENLSSGSCAGLISEIRAIGGMIAFVPFKGTMDEVKTVLMRLFDLGVVAFYCGHGPYLIRMLPPLGAMLDKDVDDVCSIIESALLDVSKNIFQTKQAQ